MKCINYYIRLPVLMSDTLGNITYILVIKYLKGKTVICNLFTKQC